MSLDDALREHTVTSTVAYAGSFLRVQKDTVKLPDGATASREFIRHPGAVLIAPMLTDAELVLERQYRHPLSKVFLEFPAGKIDAGEAPQACALRELQEETGYTAREIAHLGDIHNAIAYSDEVIHLYTARGLTAGKAKLDEHEFLETCTMSLETLLSQIRAGQVTDVKTIIAAYWLEDIAQHRKEVQWISVAGEMA
jgi:ADP-ribose pyrophosphatase